MKILSLVFILILPFFAAANDGMFMSEGGQLIPIKETSIEMRKEILYLKYTPNGIEVSVFFEFFNPDDARDEIVGFVSPPNSELASPYYEENEAAESKIKPTKHPYIEDFMVMVNEKLLPYQVNYVAKTGFHNDFFDARGGDYIYYFDVHFEPGLNVIRHHYVFKGSSGLNERNFPYRLTTGKMWAKGVIGDFTLIIDATDEVITIHNPKHSGKSYLPWIMQGLGNYKLEKDGISKIFLKSGIMTCNVVNFEPQSDLYLYFEPKHYSLLPITSGTELFQSGMLLNFFYFNPLEYKEGFESEFKDLSDEGIQLLINYFYARKGYDFKTESIKNDFMKCIWYIPNPNLKMEDIKFSDQEQVLMDLLNAEREKRKNQ
jgi:hypothetical protein